MQRNLRILPWWWVLRWAWLGEGIWVLYLTEERGLTLGQVLLFEALYSAVVIATELPTGMMADRFGRRISLVVGTVSVVFAFLAFGTSASVFVLMSAYAFFAAAETSFSGADSAMLYDSLKVVRRERDFAKYYGRLNALASAAIAGFTVLGSVIITWFPLWTPIILSAVLCTPAVLIAWFLTEPPKTEERHAYLETGRRAIALTWRSPALLWSMLLMSVMTLAIASVGVLQQFFLREAGVPLWGIGIGVAGQMVVGALGSWLAAPVGRRLGVRRVFGMMPVVSSLALFAAVPGTAWLFPVFVLPALGWNLMYPHFTVYLARRAPEAVRASVISVSNLVTGIASVIVVPIVALGMDRLGFRPTLVLLALALATAGVIAYLAWSAAERGADLDAELDAELDADPEGGEGGEGGEHGHPVVDAPDAPPVPSR